MPKKRKDVEAALEKKGFIGYDGDHKFYVYHTIDGRKTLAKTKISHSGKDIPDNILGMMARQCKLTGQQFRNLVECPLSRDTYEGILKEKGLA